MHGAIFLLSNAVNVHLVFYEMVLTHRGFTRRRLGQKSRGEGARFRILLLIVTFSVFSHRYMKAVIPAAAAS